MTTTTTTTTTTAHLGAVEALLVVVVLLLVGSQAHLDTMRLRLRRAAAALGARHVEGLVGEAGRADNRTVRRGRIEGAVGRVRIGSKHLTKMGGSRREVKGRGA